MPTVLSLPTIYPPALMAAGLIGVLALGFPASKNGTSAVAARWVSILGLLAGLALLTRRWGSWENDLVRWDGLAHAWCLLFFLAALPLFLFMEGESEIPAALGLGAVLGMTVLACANHLFLLFLGLEIMSLSTYLLIPALRRERRSLEASMKYFFSGAVAAALFLFGFSMVYALTGSMSLAVRPDYAPGVEVGVLLMMCAALFKVGAFPMQFWLPDAYEAASPELSGFMSTAIKAAGFLFLIRLAFLLPAGSSLSWLPWIAAATMTFGNLLALRQERLQRLLAYSSISHVGYLLAGVWAWLRLGASPEEASTLYLYLAAYLFMNTGAFLFVRFSGVSTLSQLRGFGRRAPGLAAFFALMLLSLAAIPPTGGFLAKFFILWDVLRAGGMGLAVAVGINSIVGMGYYFRLIKALAFEEPAGEGIVSPQYAGLAGRLTLWGCTAGTLALGLFPGFRGLLSIWLNG